MSLLSHISDNSGKYSGLAGVLAFVGQFGYHCWEHAFDQWFWERYVHGVEAKCPAPPAEVLTPRLPLTR